ncbi:Flp pilus assembly complex ATPase component [Salmonella enterica]|nr:Flp pilus assembly complex ATPase component [Salmonella enterica]EGG8542062.1 Flp pilus assembly complex ATPase component [Salmonella enterica]
MSRKAQASGDIAREHVSEQMRSSQGALVWTDKPWVNLKPVPTVSRDTPLENFPDCQITLARDGLTLPEIGERITALCGVRVIFSPDALAVGQSSGTTRALNGPLPTPDNNGRIPLDQLGGAVDRAGVTATPLVLSGLRWQGKLSGLLDMIAARTGLTPRMDNGAILFSLLETRTFQFTFLNTNITSNASVTSGSTSSMGTSGGTTNSSVSGDSSSSQQTTVDQSRNVYDDMKKTLETMLTPQKGRFWLSASTGTLTVTDTRYKKRLLTVEDPPEGRIRGAIQTPILCDKADEAEVRRAWERALSSALRLDPDAILPGELRDLISILAGIFAAQTGHLVLTTLHANSAFSIPERMITMGANAGLVADAQLLIGLISQRLVQVLCPHCRVPWSVKKDQLTTEEREYLEKYCSVEGICRPENLHFRNESGCPACRKAVVIGGKQVATVGQGVAGRSVVAEVVRPDTMLFRLLIQEGKEAAKAYWLSELGGITRRIHLLHKLNAGLVDPLDADLIVPLDEDEVTLSVSDPVTSSSDIDTALIERLALVIAASVREGLKQGVEDAIKAGITAGMAALKEVA